MEKQCPDCYKAPSREIPQNQTEINLVVLGLQGVGKSSIIKNFNLYLSRQRSRNKGLDIHTEFIELHASLLPETKRMIIEESDAFLLVYAVDNRKSFDYISDLRDKILAIKGDSTPIVIAGNKADLEQRAVHYALADCIVTIDWGLPYVELSTCKPDTTALYKMSKQVFSHPRLTVKHEATSKSTITTDSLVQSNILSESTKSDQSKIMKYLSFSFKSLVNSLGLDR